jgi:hypothetical protein
MTAASLVWPGIIQAGSSNPKLNNFGRPGLRPAEPAGFGRDRYAVQAGLDCEPP